MGLPRGCHGVATGLQPSVGGAPLFCNRQWSGAALVCSQPPFPAAQCRIRSFGQQIDLAGSRKC